jgi:hypothetical protein
VGQCLGHGQPFAHFHLQKAVDEFNGCKNGGEIRIKYEWCWMGEENGTFHPREYSFKDELSFNL